MNTFFCILIYAINVAFSMENQKYFTNFEEKEQLLLKILDIETSTIEHAYNTLKTNHKKTFWITDMHGTLSKEKEPYCPNLTPVENAIETILKAKEKGSFIIIASASDNFPLLLEQIKTVFSKADPFEKYDIKDSKTQNTHGTTTMKAYLFKTEQCLAEIISIKIEEKNRGQYFREKAYTLLASDCFPDFKNGNFSQIIFTDDNRENINYFTADIKEIYKEHLNSFSLEVVCAKIDSEKNDNIKNEKEPSLLRTPRNSTLLSKRGKPR